MREISKFCFGLACLLLAFVVVPSAFGLTPITLFANGTPTRGFSNGQFIYSDGTFIQNSDGFTTSITGAGGATTVLGDGYIDAYDGSTGMYVGTNNHSIVMVGCTGGIGFPTTNGCLTQVHPFGAWHYEFTWANHPAPLPASLSGCSFSAQTGPENAPAFTAGVTGTCTITITPNSANNRNVQGLWYCIGVNFTHSAIFTQTGATSTTSCTLSGPSTSGDLIATLMFGA